MATAVIRQNMTLGHPNMHSMMPNMSMLVAAAGQTPVIMHHTHHIGHHHHAKRPLIAPAPHNASAAATSAANDQHHRSSTAMTSLDLNQQRQLQPKALKPKLSFQHVVAYTAQPVSVQRRNARERNRVKQVNNGFANLRQHIPSEVITALTNGGRGASKKLSKVDTLKLAVEYIRRLQDLLDDTENDAASTSMTSVLSVNNSSASSFYSSSSGSTSSPLEHSIIPTCSETSASPAPSYTSDVSSSAHHHHSSSGGGQSFVQAQPPYKYEPYDGYNPEDEELLDCISWWQQQ